jgi:hypothetical protein
LDIITKTSILFQVNHEDRCLMSQWELATSERVMDLQHYCTKCDAVGIFWRHKRCIHPIASHPSDKTITLIEGKRWGVIKYLEGTGRSDAYTYFLDQYNSKRRLKQCE